MSTETLALPFDPNNESKNYLAIIVFYKAKSQYYESALMIARSVKSYETLQEESVHILRFNKDLNDATKLLGLLNILGNWKGSTKMYFAGGRLINPLKIKEVISCYLDSLSCLDFKAHCCNVEQYPFDRVGYYNYFCVASRILNKKDETMRLFLNPCKKLVLCGLIKDHPSSLNEQIQARAVASSVDWCPRFNIDLAKPLNF